MKISELRTWKQVLEDGPRPVPDRLAKALGMKQPAVAEVWRAADKIVYSRSLDKVSSARTRLERDFDPEAIRQMKVSAEHDIS